MSRNRVRPDAGWDTATVNAPKGPNGRRLCRYCKTEVPEGRETFCSKACVHEWKIRTQPSYVRFHIEMRDRGVCRECGRDTGKLRAKFTKFIDAHVRLHNPGYDPIKGSDGVIRGTKTKAKDWDAIRKLSAQFERFVRKLQRDGFTIDPAVPMAHYWANKARSFWEADHRVPVAEGGGECGLDGYQTLCTPCHKRKTAEQARRRRRQPDLPLDIPEAS